MQASQPGVEQEGGGGHCLKVRGMRVAGLLVVADEENEENVLQPAGKDLSPGGEEVPCMDSGGRSAGRLEQLMHSPMGRAGTSKTAHWQQGRGRQPGLLQEQVKCRPSMPKRLASLYIVSDCYCEGHQFSNHS